MRRYDLLLILRNLFVISLVVWIAASTYTEWRLDPTGNLADEYEEVGVWLQVGATAYRVGLATFASLVIALLWPGLGNDEEDDGDQEALISDPG